MKTPYFVLQTSKLKENYLHLEKSCKTLLKKTIIAYSIKTNSIPAVVKTLEKLGAGMEAASMNEMNLIGSPKSAVFNSPAKTDEEIKTAIKKRILINIDSKSEIERIFRITKGKSIKAGLRISIKDSKFGVEPKNIIPMINYAKSKSIIVNCLHFHQGTQLSLEEYRKNLREFSDVISKLKLNPEYLDLGGGFPDKFQLKNLNKSIEDYIHAIKESFNKFNSTIIIEPGRYLVSDSMHLMAKVIAIKENFGRRYAILDAGINLLPKITLSSYKFQLPKGNNEYLLAGPLLFSNDILARVRAQLKEGDMIKVENVGAYCLNLAWPISYSKPKIYID